MKEYKFKILRFNPEKDTKAVFNEYKVPLREGGTVLDGLFHIHKQVDPSLTFRFSCRGSVCGSCAMNINDMSRLACETQAEKLSGAIKIRPLQHMPVIKDLAVDMERFWLNYETVKPYLIFNSSHAGKEGIISPEERKRLDGLVECILCGLCFGACPVTSLSGDYLGPAALLKLERFMEDRRDEYKERLGIGIKRSGTWGCRKAYNCQEVCPKNLSPARAISSIKLKAIKNRIV
jgi:succinate dehydrogenase / fumarate reductase iron-sulfur subunit